jgi:hypothetical protein
MVPTCTEEALKSDSSECCRRYNELVRRSPQGALFCHTWWLDAVAPGSYDLLTVGSGDEIQAAWPIVWESGRQRSRMVMPPLTQKLGILFAPNKAKYAERLSQEHHWMDELLSKIPPNTYVEAQFHENFTNWLPFHWQGYQQTTRYTYVFEDLTNLDHLWEEMRHGARCQIRKAQKCGIRCREIEDASYFYDLNKRIFARRGLDTPYTCELFVRLDEACRRNAHRKIMIAEDAEGRPHASRYYVYDERCLYAIAGGADDVLRNSGACNLLDWEMIRFASTVSQRFDFTGSVTPGIEQYMREFGPKRAPYSLIWGYAHRVPNSRLRRFAGRVLRKMARIVDP